MPQIEFPMPGLEEFIIKAVVEKFFEPLDGDSYAQPIYPQGGQSYNSQPIGYTNIQTKHEAPLVTVTRHIYKENQDKIIQLILEKLDFDALAQGIADRMVADLKDKDYRGGFVDSALYKKIKEDVNEKVAAELVQVTLQEMKNHEDGKRCQNCNEVSCSCAKVNPDPTIANGTFDSAPVHTHHGPGGYAPECQVCNPQ